MRGYPRLSPMFLQHLIDIPVQSAQWLVPSVTRPDREGMTFEARGRWTLAPRAPRLTAPVAFISWRSNAGQTFADWQEKQLGTSTQ